MKSSLLFNLMLSVLCALMSAVIVYQAGNSILLTLLTYSGSGSVFLTLFMLLSALDVVDE